MIVNPQLFNYRLIIGFLLVVVAGLTLYSFTGQKSIEAQNQFLEQEKKLIESELAQIIERYDDVSIFNNEISHQLEDAKRATKLTLDSLSAMRRDLETLTKLREQLTQLQLKNKILFKNTNSLDQIKNDLKKENTLIDNQIQIKTLENSSLIEQNKSLTKRLEKGALLSANSLRAKSFERVLGKKKSSAKAKRVQTIEVCFILAENALAKTGEKDIYIQIVNPKNNVVADKGSVNFETSTLIYSAKKVIDYSNEILEVCLDIDADNNDTPLQTGNYYISVFHKNKKLGSTSVTLE